jgi:hypothetical protein
MATDGVNPDGSMRGRLDQLPRQAFDFARRSHPDQTTPKDGEPTSKTTRVLNPQFVEALMGWPIGWSACGSWATESSPSKPLSPSDSSTNDCEAADG